MELFFSNFFTGRNLTPILNNQRVENAGVAFVKGADERNKFFEKTKQSVMYDEQGRANKAKD